MWGDRDTGAALPQDLVPKAQVLELALPRPGGIQKASSSSSPAIDLAVGPELESW